MIDATQAIPFVPLDGRHRPDRLPRLLGLQAPAVAARDGLPLRPARPLGRARATERQLARGGPAVRPLLRRAADAGTGRAPVRRVARPGSRGSARRHRCACSPNGRRPAPSRPSAAWPRAWPAGWACPGTAARSSARQLDDGEAARARVPGGRRQGVGPRHGRPLRGPRLQHRGRPRPRRGGDRAVPVTEPGRRLRCSRWPARTPPRQPGSPRSARTVPHPCRSDRAPRRRPGPAPGRPNGAARRRAAGSR